MTETPAEIIARLRAKEPVWRADKKLKNMSITGESRASYDQRFAAWESAMARAQALKREGA